MRTLGVMFATAVAFFLFSAQNCNKRDPIVEKGSTHNPALVGLAYGQMYLTVKPDTTNSFPVSGATVNLALSKDSLAGKMFLSTKISNDSGLVFFDNLYIGKTYHVSALYLEGGVTELKADTFYKANPVQLPTRENVYVKRK